ncbi:asparaginase [Deinococcus peraridilitoris]|uniref:L-asparaginase/GlutRNAGln amidotransferase subunit D n=1 Tax=Deinococcus peraridilitoris (strain DSM 19664 / LMG 22246 / CIP 109416 / KR-200) TaxID=937777 RepID=L0A2C0_DEIPD|nr:asparaginase [Deinococcus peraridilitoris]AFZ67130.1 L-asparaginase/GlutRNAGln amidotransferase subunit D [Deinococcus peraridilitoris DSM 19664]
MSSLALIHTGGTIASNFDARSGSVTPQSAPAIPEMPGVQVTDFQPFQLPSPHIRVEHMQRLRHLIEKVSRAFDGVVLTHGTDTLEETAYFLHLTLTPHAPVVLTGSMRHAGEASWDGPGNLRDAAEVALHPETRGRGPLAVFGGDVFDARTVTKTHTTALGAFGGYPGPIGRVDGKRLRFFARPEERPVFAPPEVSARVEILYAYAGWQGEGFHEAAQRADGLVIAALGTGNLPPELPALIAACARPVVIATRTHAGPVLPLYGYAGGGATLVGAGAIPASFLNAHKARILLIVLLSLGRSREQIREVFEQGNF